MKIAVCFSGQTRTAIQAAPNLLRFFGEHLPDIDFFIHTWDINQLREYGSQLGDRVPPPWRPDIKIVEKPIVKVSDEDLAEYRKIYNPKSMIVDVYNEYLTKFLPELRGRDPILHYTWRKSIHLCLEYSLRTGTKYDAVIKLRPDVIFPPNRKLSTEIEAFLNKPECFFCDNGTSTTTDDIFWLSSLKTMLATIDFGDPELSLDRHLLFANYILSIGIEISPMIGLGYAPLRPEAIGYNVLTEFAKIFNSDHFWYSSAIAPLGWIDYE